MFGQIKPTASLGITYVVVYIYGWKRHRKVLYMPVPAFLCMQDVNRGEVAPWVVYGYREEHSKA